MPNTVLLIKDQGHVRGVEGVKHCTLIPIKDQKAMYIGGVESGVCGKEAPKVSKSAIQDSC